MSKRGSIGLFVLLSTLIVAAGAIYYVSKEPSTTGMVYLSRNIYMPAVVNPYGNQRVDMPYSFRGSVNQYVYTSSYGLRNNPRMTMWDCQTYCFGRPEGGPSSRYQKISYGGKSLRGCLAECNEQRLGILDTVENNYYYDKAKFDRPMYYNVVSR